MLLIHSQGLSLAHLLLECQLTLKSALTLPAATTHLQPLLHNRMLPNFPNLQCIIYWLERNFNLYLLPIWHHCRFTFYHNSSNLNFSLVATWCICVFNFSNFFSFLLCFVFVPFSIHLLLFFLYSIPINSYLLYHSSSFFLLNQNYGTWFFFDFAFFILGSDFIRPKNTLNSIVFYYIARIILFLQSIPLQKHHNVILFLLVILGP